MTTEQLMQPRYKVIADYPCNPYKIGHVIIMPDDRKSFHLYTSEYTDEFGEYVKLQTHVRQSEADKYPHLFIELKWWEDREEKDLPKYIKPIKSQQYCFKLNAITGDHLYFTNNKGESTHQQASSMLPATDEEYKARELK